jgi:hypothetical protein
MPISIALHSRAGLSAQNEQEFLISLAADFRTPSEEKFHQSYNSGENTQHDFTALVSAMELLRLTTDASGFPSAPGQ